MKQAILVKYLSATNTKGTRLKASTQAKSITLGREYALNMPEDALRVARELQQKLDWSGHLAGGVLPNGDYVFVLLGTSK